MKSERYAKIPGLETRLFLDGSFLMMGGSLCAGRAYVLLKDFVADIGRRVFQEVLDDSEIYDRLESIADESTDLTCRPTFLGTRSDPSMRGVVSNISEDNLTIGSLAYALLRGVAEELHGYYAKMQSPRRLLIGSGNGLRRNPMLKRAVELVFGQTVRIPSIEETAAFGAALVAGVGIGAIGSYDEAARCIRYLE
jgi:sedoheptulokinase